MAQHLAQMHLHSHMPGTGAPLLPVRRQQPGARHRCRATSEAPRAPQAPAAPPRQKTAEEQRPSNGSQGVTIEYQRQQAKALQQYFRAMNAQKIAQGSKLFGWTGPNEILNGRWVMFGLLVGLLTEYATGVNFPDQIKLLVSYLGIADIYD